MTKEIMAKAGFLAFLFGVVLLGLIYVLNLSRDPFTLGICFLVIIAAVFLISFYSPVE